MKRRYIAIISVRLGIIIPILPDITLWISLLGDVKSENTDAEWNFSIRVCYCIFRLHPVQLVVISQKGKCRHFIGKGAEKVHRFGLM